MEQKAAALNRAKNIKLIIFDVDGVLTDGGIYIGEQGELYKPFFCRDGLGITLAQQAGIKTVLLPKRNEKDLVEVPKNVKQDLQIILVEEVGELIKHAIVPAAKTKTKASAKGKSLAKSR